MKTYIIRFAFTWFDWAMLLGAVAVWVTALYQIKSSIGLFGFALAFVGAIAVAVFGISLSARTVADETSWLDLDEESYDFDCLLGAPDAAFDGEGDEIFPVWQLPGGSYEISQVDREEEEYAVEGIDPETGEIHVARFWGPYAQERAAEYADFMNFAPRLAEELESEETLG
jgi:hypothetical protein